MNGPLKKTAVACLLMFGLLMVNVNYLQGVRAEELNADSRNTRNFFARYEVERGRITAGDKVLAESVDTGGKFRFARRYPEGPLYAHVTGFFAPESATGIEGARNRLLDGSSADLLIRRSIDLITNKTTRGASVDLTIVPAAQEAAYEALRASGKRGAVVALEPKTGAILAMVSLPTYDPNELAKPDKAAVNKAYQELTKSNTGSPLLNRATDRTYPPGSTYKVVTAAAFLEDDDSRGPQTVVDAPQVLDLPNTTASLPNYGGAACGVGQVPLVFALERSCNTPFGKIGMELGYDAMNEQARKFGVGEPLAIPMPVAQSSFGEEEDAAALAQASIGQRNNQMTPLEMAMIAAGIANDGTVMKPYLVNKVADAEGVEVESADPDTLTEATSPDTARKLRDMMVSVVANGTATAAQIPGVDVGGKTGTAETARGQAPHAWFISFAPAQEPKVAVAVIVESGSAGNDVSGGRTAAPIAKAVMEAVLGR
jgi:peptidoglycan glycosyltransferase